jgi:hypothetical protein
VKARSVRRERGIELLPRRPEGRQPWYEQDAGEQHPEPRAVSGRPAQGGRDQQIDGRIFQKVDAVREQGNRTDSYGNDELNPKISEVQQSDAANNPVKAGIGNRRGHIIGIIGLSRCGVYTVSEAAAGDMPTTAPSRYGLSAKWR